MVRLIQADPEAQLLDVSDQDPVRVGADTDVVDVAVLMSDYNLITIPVVDEDRRMIGLITVDDVLEVTLPDGRHFAAGLVGVANGAAILRVHDVEPHRQALQVLWAISAPSHLDRF